MLKIKYNVNLKELEKFGFKNTINNIYSKRMKYSDNDFKTSILVNLLNKEVENQVVYYVNNDEYFEEIELDFINLTGELDVLYDLFEAGLLEKVGD